jgi:hypothetical protein
VITGPITPLPPTATRPWRSPAAQAEASGRTWVTLGIVLIALGILGGVVWGIFLSPFGFSRFPLEAQQRSFVAHQAGSYVVYLEGPGASQPSLPPALDVSATGAAGQRVDVRPLGRPGQVGAPDAYHVAGFEGRAVAVVTLRRAGPFLLTVTARSPGEYDPTRYAGVGDGTIAVGRSLGRGWPTTQWCGLLMVGLPVLLGVVAIVTGRRRRRRRKDQWAGVSPSIGAGVNGVEEAAALR